MDGLSQEFDHQLAGLCWSLWSELGVSGVERFHKDCLIQLEELIILTAIVSKYDPRLCSEALDWISRYHDYISVTRLRALVKVLDREVQQAFSRLAALVNSVSTAKWPQGNETEKFKGTLSGKSSLTKLEPPALLALRLRSLFGPGTKADILTFYFTKKGIGYTAADLVELGYSKRSLMTALDHLAEAGLMDVSEERNTKLYELKRRRELHVVIGKLPSTAPPWSKILEVILTIRSVIPGIEKGSESTRGILLRNCLSKIESLLPAFIPPLLSSRVDFKRDWKGVIDILRAFSKGNFSGHFQVYDEFDEVIALLFRDLYQVDDCMDGIEMIESNAAHKSEQHKRVYKECYQLFLSFVGELEVKLRNFLEFPFHKIMDERLCDIIYTFSREKLPKFEAAVQRIVSVNQILNPASAVREYRVFMPNFDELRGFIHTFRKRLQDVYFAKTDVHLLTLPTVLYKRHQILKLFDPEKK